MNPAIPPPHTDSHSINEASVNQPRYCKAAVNASAAAAVAVDGCVASVTILGHQSLRICQVTATAKRRQRRLELVESKLILLIFNHIVEDFRYIISLDDFFVNSPRKRNTRPHSSSNGGGGVCGERKARNYLTLCGVLLWQ